KRGKLEEPAIARLLKEAGLDDKAIESVFGLSRIQTLDDAAVYLGGESASVVSIRTFLESMTGYGFRDQLHFDLSVVRGLGYYTGIVFEAFDAEKKFRAIFGGGRYDRLLADIGGKPISAVGLGFGDVVIAELLVEKGRLPTEWPSIDVAVGFMEDAQRPAALRAARAFREAGSDVDLALRAEKPKHFFARVGRGHIGRAIYIGPDDVQRGIVRVKNLKDRTEVERPIDAVAGG
ncbi:MAG: ATP phosphoribosyltransferase regulatory subunit, partial [Lentisphaerae bacterium]|nr:ATP phosphoribosyltransferase regulatory subunit [Lentisphaerota bacterium]